MVKQLDIIRKQCLWRGNSDTPKQALTVWHLLCKLKMSGGVGIINFGKQNEALLLKYLDKFYYDAEVPWVKLIWFSYYPHRVPHSENLCALFWWRYIMKLVDNYRAVAQCRGIVESSHGMGAIELGREVGFRDEGDSGVGMSKSLPCFGSRNGGETLRAAIIHYKAICADYSEGLRICLRLCPKASRRPAYKGVRT